MLHPDFNTTIDDKPRLHPVMLAGTGSDVGKSLLAAGLCRIFKQDGYSPCPFKAQNMALNSYVTPDGLEIGRAQAMQAEAAGIECSVEMNPLLLKPSSDQTSQVVLYGKPIGNMRASQYFRREGRDRLRAEVNRAFDTLNAKYNPIVMEGAGSISEINLRDLDLVNMPMARHANADVILVADIDRGGVFASVYGSIALQLPEDKHRIKGIIINKFRGDERLFDDGRRMLQDICHVPVLGVVPYMHGLNIEEEDSLSAESRISKPVAGKINIAIVRLRHMSNFTDFKALEFHPSVNAYYAARPADIDGCEILILPGSKATIDDMRYLRSSGMADAIINAHDKGKTIFGICGGYQMMGSRIDDPLGIEGAPSSIAGLGLLPTSTVITDSKTTSRVEFRFLDYPDTCHGYEIHMGHTTAADDSPLCHIDGAGAGYFRSDRCMGSYIHGILDNAVVVNYLLQPYAACASNALACFDYHEAKEREYNHLAEVMRSHLDMQLLYKILSTND